MRNISKIILTGGMLVCTAASADIQPGVNYYLGATSDYVFRGISQSDNHPAAQASVEYQHHGGFYAGLWGTTQDISNTRAHVRGDAYMGIRYEDISGFGFDVGGRFYSNAFVYPGQTRDEFWELYGDFSFGPFSIKLSHDFDNQDSYAEGAIKQSLGSGVFLRVHFGHYFLKGPRGIGDDYSDYSLGLSKQFGSLEAGLTVTDTNQKPSSDLNDAIVFLWGNYLF